MALRNIRIIGDDILRKKCRKVETIDDKIKTLMDDMLETMYYEEGVGLAAPQIGILKRIVVIDVDDGNIYKMINPEIISSSGEEVMEEGCLSVPDNRGDVVRPSKVKARYTDENGEVKEIEAEGLLARCICHELDHLDGILFVDRMEKNSESHKKER